MSTQTTLQPEALTTTCVCNSVHPKAGDICKGCRAASNGRNCFDSAVSPCCDLPRTACDTCPVFGAILREMSLTDRVMIILEGGASIEGEVYLRPHQRTSDVLNDGEKPYITVANATLHYPVGSGLPAEERKVILVAKRATTLIFPVASDG